MKKIAIITDSSVYLKKEFIEENKDCLKVIPLPLILNNEKTIYNENEVNPEDFKKLIKEGKVKTSQTPIGVLEQKWDEFLEEYDYLIIAGISKHLSGMYDNTVKLSKEKKYSKRVYVLDTEAVSVILEKEIKYIISYIKTEEITTLNSLKGIEKEIKKIKRNHKCLIFPSSLETLKAGGRITKSAALLSNILKIYPILILKKGKIDKYGIMKSYIKGIRKQISYGVDNYKIDKLDIITTEFDDKRVQKEFDIMISEFNFKKINYIKIPNVILAHLGYNTVGISFWI